LAVGGKTREINAGGGTRILMMVVWALGKEGLRRRMEGCRDCEGRTILTYVLNIGAHDFGLRYLGYLGLVIYVKHLSYNQFKARPLNLTPSSQYMCTLQPAPTINLRARTLRRDRTYISFPNESETKGKRKHRRCRACGFESLLAMLKMESANPFQGFFARNF